MAENGLTGLGLAWRGVAWQGLETQRTAASTEAVVRWIPADG
ncbi:hypothetical protein [Pseudomonas phage vB_Pae_CF55b]|nr:hypothetical protein [Pseudomonas phage vB_Pae_CF55b]